MEDKVTLFVDVILPLALPKTYVYRVPSDLNEEIELGKRVVVQFGKSKMYSGLISNIHQTAPKDYTAKYLDSVLDERPVVNTQQFKFWHWISDYYLCTLGQVMNAALPGGLKLNSESRVILHPDCELNFDSLSDKEFVVAEALEIQQVLTIEEVNQILERKNSYPIIKSLINKRVALIQEEIREKYTPKTVDYIRLTEEIQSEHELKKVFDDLARAPKQLEILMSFIQLSNYFNNSQKEVKKLILQKSVEGNSSLVNQLVKKGVFEIYSKTEGRLNKENNVDIVDAKLSDIQLNKLNEIKGLFNSKKAILLHGVTSSGKTEVYIKLMQEVIDKGEQVLYLLPEIALTTQIINRLTKRFGNKVGVYHSKFNQNERVEIWKDVLEKQDYQIILGARSALFLPFENLGLIVVDEEHESSFKQHDPSPRYNARDASLVLAQIHDAKVLLGSATPALETYRNAQEGKFGLVEMTKRYGDVQMPEILVADVQNDMRKKRMKGHLTEMLYKSIETAIEAKEQVILFQNRRGFSPFIQCETCSWVPQCKNCDVNLTYHKHRNHYICHYCGFKSEHIKSCNACGSFELKLKGFGTEKIEDDLSQLFPKLNVKRLDLDTTRTKNAYQQIIGSFEDREIDILVGTQMITKGLDFDNVALVGILNADNMLNFADFRAFERSYQLMAQVAGRAGRKKKRGKVIIQTYEPYHTIIRDVIDNNYQNMYKNELLDRRNFHYPPFYRLIRFTLRHRRTDQLNDSSRYFAQLLKDRFGTRVLGPEFPPIARIRNLYNKNVLLKIEREASIAKAKEIVKEILAKMASEKPHSSVRIIVDVDPI